jgi:hypothetical protein
VDTTRSELTPRLPDGWSFDPAGNGMLCNGYYALDVRVFLDAQARIVVGSFIVDTEPCDDWTGSLRDWVAFDLATRGFNWDGLDPTQEKQVLDLVEELRWLAEPEGNGEFGALVRAYLASQDIRPRGEIDGGSFLFDIPAGVPAVWGQDRDVLWSKGEALMIAGPQGVRKTTIAGHLAFGLAGVPGFEELCEQHIEPLPDDKIVYYLAMDRPQQIARCLRRLAPPEHRALIAERVKFWQGPLTFDVVREPERLAQWMDAEGAGAVIVDSLKDIAGKLSDEEVGALLNRAFQECIARGVQTCVLHHNRKANADNKRPKALADVHGSENLTRGLGSVVCLYGAAGDLEIELSHLKQPAEVVGPYVLHFDPDTGRASVASRGELPTGAKASRDRALKTWMMGNGGAARAFTFEELEAEGTFGKKQTLRDALVRLVASGWLRYTEGGGRGHPSTWSPAPLETTFDVPFAALIPTPEP